jgi:hypothetical protein
MLSSPSKIIEKMVSVQLVNHFDHNKLLFENQFEVQREKSTEHNLLKVVNYIGGSINSWKYCINIFFDLDKAFYVVSHDILVEKLEKLGIQGVALDWFKSSLSNRRQVVDSDSNISITKKVCISIFQGSIPRRILFLLFLMNHLNLPTFLQLCLQMIHVASIRMIN